MSRLESMTRHCDWKFPKITDPRKRAVNIIPHGRGFRTINIQKSFSNMIFETVGLVIILGFFTIFFGAFFAFFLYGFWSIGVRLFTILSGNEWLAKVAMMSISIVIILLIVFWLLSVEIKKYNAYFRNRNWNLILEAKELFRRGEICYVKIKRQHLQGYQDNRQKQIWSRLVCHEVTENSNGTTTTYHSQQMWVHEFEPETNFSGDILISSQVHLPSDVPISHYSKKVWVVWEWQVIIEIGGRVEDKASFMVEVL